MLTVVIKTYNLWEVKMRQHKKVEQLELPCGREPFSEWFDKLDTIAQARIALYIDRVAAGGSKKNIKSIGNKVLR